MDDSFIQYKITAVRIIKVNGATSTLFVSESRLFDSGFDNFLPEPNLRLRAGILTGNDVPDYLGCEIKKAQFQISRIISRRHITVDNGIIHFDNVRRVTCIRVIDKSVLFDSAAVFRGRLRGW